MEFILHCCACFILHDQTDNLLASRSKTDSSGVKPNFSKFDNYEPSYEYALIGAIYAWFIMIDVGNFKKNTGVFKKDDIWPSS